LGDCEIAVIVSLFIRLISCWNTPQNVGNSLSELFDWFESILIGLKSEIRSKRVNSPHTYAPNACAYINTLIIIRMISNDAC
jgi:hypothetical protein